VKSFRRPLHGFDVVRQCYKEGIRGPDEDNAFYTPSYARSNFTVLYPHRVDLKSISLGILLHQQEKMKTPLKKLIFFLPSNSVKCYSHLFRHTTV
jgi:hypothetical protein